MLQDFYARKGLDFTSVKMLSITQFREMLAIFRKLWTFFSQPQRPVILYISSKAPAIRIKLNEIGLGNFNYFKGYIKTRKVELKPGSIKEYFSVRLKQVFITQRIPAQYIMKYDVL